MHTRETGNIAKSNRAPYLWVSLSLSFYMAWTSVQLAWVGMPSNYTYTLAVCTPFVVGTAVCAAWLNARGRTLEHSSATVLCLSGALLNALAKAPLPQPLPGVLIAVSCLLCGALCLHWAHHLACTAKERIIPTVAIAGLVSSCALLFEMAGQVALDVLLVALPAACALCTLAAHRHDTDEAPSTLHDKLHTAWPLPCAMLACTFAATLFASLLHNPFTMTSGTAFAYKALFGSAMCLALLGWTLFAHRRNLNGFLVIATFVLELSLLAFATGVISYLSIPINAIAASGYLLTILMWILAAHLARSPRTRAPYLLVFGAFLSIGTGFAGTACGFVLSQTLNIPFASLQTLALIVLTGIAIVLIVFFSIEVVVMRSSIEDEAARQVAEIQTSAAQEVENTKEHAEREVERAKAEAKRAISEAAQAKNEAEESLANVRETVDKQVRITMRGACQLLAGRHGLTEREKELAALMCDGMTRHEIAKKWNVSENTVKYHLRNMYRKLEVHSAHELIAYAEETRLDVFEEPG